MSEHEVPPAKRPRLEDEGQSSQDSQGFGLHVTAEEVDRLREFQVLDEVKSDDEDSNEGSDKSESSEELPEEEIEKMLEEDLPEDFKGAPKPKEKKYVMRQKIILEEKGTNYFEVLPLDWLMVRHCSGMPLYMHRGTRVCTLAKPYSLGQGNTRRHDIPISAIPCFAYRIALKEEQKQMEIDKKIAEEIKNGTWTNKPTDKNDETPQMAEDKADCNGVQAKCPFSHLLKDDSAGKNDVQIDINNAEGASSQSESSQIDSKPAASAQGLPDSQNLLDSSIPSDTPSISESKHLITSSIFSESLPNPSIYSQPYPTPTAPSDSQRLPNSSIPSDTPSISAPKHSPASTIPSKSSSISESILNSSSLLDSQLLPASSIPSSLSDTLHLATPSHPSGTLSNPSSLPDSRHLPAPSSSLPNASALPNPSSCLPDASGQVETPSQSLPNPSSCLPDASGHVETPSSSLPNTSECLKESSECLKESSECLKESSECLKESSECLKESSECLKESSECLKESSECLKESSECLKESSECLKESSECLEESSECLKESSECLKESSECLKESSECLKESSECLSEPSGPVEPHLRGPGARPVQLPGGRLVPPPRVESLSSSWKARQLTPAEIHDYCKRLFKFKEVHIMHFERWADRRRYTKARKTLQYPALPAGAKLITIPARDAPDAGGKTAKRDWVMNMNGCSYLSVFHEYVRRALHKQPVYEFKQLENATAPYQATVYIGGMQYGVGRGSSKRQAKSQAARASIHILIPEMRDELPSSPGDLKLSKDDPDFTFFDYVTIEDPRIQEFCGAAAEPSPHAILRTCLLRNFGAGDRHIHTEMKKLEFQKIELTMKVGKHSATVVCKNKKQAKQRASQHILQQLHPHIRSWGSLLRLYGSRSVKSCKEKKQEEQQITLLQDKARHNEPNHAVLEKLRNEMAKLKERDNAVVPIGTLLVADLLPRHSGSNLNNVDL